MPGLKSRSIQVPTLLLTAMVLWMVLWTVLPLPLTLQIKLPRLKLTRLNRNKRIKQKKLLKVLKIKPRNRLLRLRLLAQIKQLRRAQRKRRVRSHHRPLFTKTMTLTLGHLRSNWSVIRKLTRPSSCKKVIWRQMYLNYWRRMRQHMMHPWPSWQHPTPSHCQAVLEICRVERLKLFSSSCSLKRGQSQPVSYLNSNIRNSRPHHKTKDSKKLYGSITMTHDHHYATIIAKNDR